MGRKQAKMGRKQIVTAVLIIILLAGIAGETGFSASLLRASKELGPGFSNSPQVLPTWQQANSNGFGDPDAGEVSALETFNGYLYAGTSNSVDGARIFRSPDGMSWTPVIDPGFGITHDIRPPAILDMMVFNGRLYASTGLGDGPGQIWRTVNGTTWAPMVIHGFNDPDTVDITALAEYGGWIYAGATNLVSGAQIWRSFSGDGNIGSWTKVAPGMQGPYGTRITGFAQFGGALYAAVETAGSVQVWRSTNGTNWAAVMSNGFGDSLTKVTGGMAEFGGYLYVGAGNDTKGAQLWRSNNGTSWVQAITPAFSDPNNLKIELVNVFGNKLFISTKNSTTGAEIWRSADGNTWEQVNQDGFGDSHNTGSNCSNAATTYLSKFYLGTSNDLDGGELWRLQSQLPPPPSPTPTRTPTPTQTPIFNPAYVPLILR
jgi:hypothetical protein